MHILVIPSWYPSPKNPHNGNFVQRHLELIAKNHQLSILNFISDERTSIDIIEIKTGNSTEYQIYYPKKSSKLSQFFYLRKAFLKTVKQIKNVDVIHGHVILEKGLLNIWAKKHYRKPLLITEHGSYFFKENYHTLSVFQKMTIIQVMKQSDRFSCVSDVLKDEINYLFPRKKITITANSIDTELFTPQEKEVQTTLNFIHISNFGKVKNVAQIIEAFEKLNQVYPNFTLTLIAEVSNHEIENQIIVSTINEKIKLIGPLTRQEIAQQLQQTDALVMLSSHETFSCVIAEAWSCGKPIISTEVGIAKALKPHLGIPIANTSSDALLDALNQFITQKNRFNVNEIRQEALQFSDAIVLDAFEKMYESVL